jgi:hypothetical protein
VCSQIAYVRSSPCLSIKQRSLIISRLRIPNRRYTDLGRLALCTRADLLLSFYVLAGLAVEEPVFFMTPVKLHLNLMLSMAWIACFSLHLGQRHFLDPSAHHSQTPSDVFLSWSICNRWWRFFWSWGLCTCSWTAMGSTGGAVEQSHPARR